MPALDTGLTKLLTRLAPQNVLAGARFIEAGDEARLSPREAEGFSSSTLTVRRASGAARDIVRTLVGGQAEVIGRPGSPPTWPQDLVGSISHDDSVAAALIARRGNLGGLGVDVEPDEPLEAELAAMIGLQAELDALSKWDMTLRQLFSVKEAVFKAVFPVDGRMLDFRDVQVRFDDATALTAYGRTVNWRSLRAGRVFAAAWW
jgi:4'-phosphopantetheinyl transferase EntD